MFEVVTYNKTLPSEFFMEIFEIPTKGFFKNESDTLLELSVNSMKLLTARYIYIYIYISNIFCQRKLGENTFSKVVCQRYTLK